MIAPIPRRFAMAETSERRTRRSDDPIIALHYQLSAVRKEAGLEAVVLVDGSGCLVAGAGAWPVCEELAAYAPFLADRTLPQTAEVAGRAAEIAREAHVRAMSLDGAEVLLCARGGGAMDVTPSIVRAAAGCRRILGGEA
jgi:hypothetical protein